MDNTKYTYESYYDGIPQEIKKMSPEELEKAITKEDERLKNISDWDQV